MVFYDKACREIDGSRLRELYDMGDRYRLVARDRMTTIDSPYEKKVTVVTVWEGADAIGDRRIFSTMIYGGKLCGHMFRYRDLAAAHTGHEDIVRRVRKELRLPY